MNKHLKHLLLILTIFAFSIALRLFVFEIYAIPSSSMKNTLIPGDKVLVNKMLIGPRMPRSPFEIPWVNLAFMLSKDAETPANGKLPKPYINGKGLNQTIDFFGPLVVPSKGYTIKMYVQNFHLYKKTIRDCEARKIRMTNDIIYIDGQAVDSYTFQHDYYFMMGDHRYDSKDSRYIGPVPENRIIGKTQRILFSEKDGFKYPRILQKMH